jgi:acetyl esterase
MQGNLETHDYLCRKIASMLYTEVVSIEYRLAPEYVFPAQLDDVLSTYLWCNREFSDRDIIISGDSAGGSLSAALCIRLAEMNLAKPPWAQILFYPALFNDFDSNSFQEFGDVPALTRDGAIQYAAQYMGVTPETVRSIKNKFFCPLLEDDVRVFPKTILVSASADVLIDEHKAFAEKLTDGGVEVVHIIVPGVIHGFMTFGNEFEDEVSSTLLQIGQKI